MADVFIISRSNSSEINMQSFSNSNNDAIIDKSNRGSKVSDASIAFSELEYNVSSAGSRCRTNLTSGYDSDDTSLRDMDIAIHQLERTGKNRVFYM